MRLALSSPWILDINEPARPLHLKSMPSLLRGISRSSGRSSSGHPWPTHVRVQFYAYRHQVRDGLRPDMESIVRLEKSGDLSLFAVRRLWGLETSSIIDPHEMKLGFTADPNWLPASVVKDLIRKHGCIKLIEPYASYETRIKRELRHVALAGISVFNSWSILAHNGVKHDYRAVRHRLSQPIYVSESRYLDWTRALNLAVFLLVSFFVFAYAMDLDLGLQRFGAAVADTVAASPVLRFACAAGLVALFLAAPEGQMRALGIEEGKIMLVLSA
ncbi:hypothetical protein B0H15DRAFT_863464 [Mycena belliarum]|uniref:Uncharacterized protein n=1 Tax=Mycena belliarum TaxID=1033014 RepID=A0AAD6TWD7_9AGAR|nr:hypothetical protein B0H15DRAFT_863464 [Mycena belliae]